MWPELVDDLWKIFLGRWSFVILLIYPSLFCLFIHLQKKDPKNFSCYLDLSSRFWGSELSVVVICMAVGDGCKAERKKQVILPYQFGWFLFHLLIWLMWLGLPLICCVKVVRVDIPVLFLTLEGKLSFHHWVWC